MSPILTEELDEQEAKLLAKRKRKASLGRALYNATSDYKIAKQNTMMALDGTDHQLNPQSGGATSPLEFNSLTASVWINTNSGVWHARYQRWHQNTKDGFLSTIGEAQRLGYRASANGQ